MIQEFGLVAWLLSFLFASGACLVFSRRFFPLSGHNNGLILSLLLCLGYGPILISFILCFFFIIVPGRSVASYLLMMLVVFSLLYLVPYLAKFRSTVFAAPQGFRLLEASLGFGRGVDALVFSALGFTIILGLLSVALFPLYSNDPLEYFKTAQILGERMDLSVYPVLDTSVSNGFYGPWTHPPGFTGLLTWSNFFSSDANIPGVARYVSWYYATVTALLIAAWVPRVGVLSALLFLTMPIYFAGISSSHIDPARVFPILAVFVFLSLYASSTHCFKKRSFVFLSAFSLCSCFFLHSIGILIAPIWGVSILFVWLSKKASFKRTMTSGILTAILLALFISPFLYLNYQKTGRLVSDTPKIWTIEKINHSQFISEQRNIATSPQKIFNGLLKGLTKPKSFGVLYWLFVLALLLFFVRVLKERCDGNEFSDIYRENSIEILCYVIVLTYFFMTVVATLLGSDAFIKNDRYPLTIHPFVAIASGFGVRALAKRLFSVR